MISPPMYSWYPPNVLNTPRCTEYPPMYSWYPSDVLNTPRCTHDIPPMYSWYPPMYWTPPDVLNIPRCTEHTLYGVINIFLTTILRNQWRLLMSKNAISANLEHYIFKIFRGSMPPDPPRRPKKNFFRCSVAQNFFQDRLPPNKKS